jgi:hypothetical protein
MRASVCFPRFKPSTRAGQSRVKFPEHEDERPHLETSVRLGIRSSMVAPDSGIPSRSSHGEFQSHEELRIAEDEVG